MSEKVVVYSDRAGVIGIPWRRNEQTNEEGMKTISHDYVMFKPLVNTDIPMEQWDVISKRPGVEALEGKYGLKIVTLPTIEDTGEVNIAAIKNFHKAKELIKNTVMTPDLKMYLAQEQGRDIDGLGPRDSIVKLLKDCISESVKADQALEDELNKKKSEQTGLNG